MTQFGTFKQVKTAWRCSGEGKDVILLHGWGQNMLMMSRIEEHLKEQFRVWNFDFPGFGESDQPPALALMMSVSVPAPQYMPPVSLSRPIPLKSG